MKRNMLNLDAGVNGELANDEKQINKYLKEHYPELSFPKLVRFEKLLKVINIISQGIVLFVNRNEFLIFDQDSQKQWWLSVIASVLCFVIGGWLSMKTVAPSKYAVGTRKGIEVLFISVVLILQFLLVELYLIDISSQFWTALHAVLLVLLTEKYLKETKIGVSAQVMSVCYILVRYSYRFDIDVSQIIVGSLFLSLQIFQNFTRKVLYQNKLQILRITRVQLSAVRQFYNDLLGLIPQGLTLLDSSSNIIFANSRVTEILQCNNDEIFSILMNLSNKNSSNATGTVGNTAAAGTVGAVSATTSGVETPPKNLAASILNRAGGLCSTINGGDSSVFSRNGIYSVSSRQQSGARGVSGIMFHEKTSPCENNNNNNNSRIQSQVVAAGQGFGCYSPSERKDILFMKQKQSFSGGGVNFLAGQKGQNTAAAAGAIDKGDLEMSFRRHSMVQNFRTKSGSVENSSKLKVMRHQRAGSKELWTSAFQDLEKTALEQNGPSMFASQTQKFSSFKKDPATVIQDKSIKKEVASDALGDIIIEKVESGSSKRILPGKNKPPLTLELNGSHHDRSTFSQYLIPEQQQQLFFCDSERVITPKSGHFLSSQRNQNDQSRCQSEQFISSSPNIISSPLACSPSSRLIGGVHPSQFFKNYKSIEVNSASNTTTKNNQSNQFTFYQSQGQTQMGEGIPKRISMKKVFSEQANVIESEMDFVRTSLHSNVIDIPESPLFRPIDTQSQMGYMSSGLRSSIQIRREPQLSVSEVQQQQQQQHQQHQQSSAGSSRLSGSPTNIPFVKDTRGAAYSQDMSPNQSLSLMHHSLFPFEKTSFRKESNSASQFADLISESNMILFSDQSVLKQKFEPSIHEDGIRSQSGSGMGFVGMNAVEKQFMQPTTPTMKQKSAKNIPAGKSLFQATPCVILEANEKKRSKRESKNGVQKLNSSSLKASTKRKKDSEGHGGDNSDAVAGAIGSQSQPEFPKQQNNKASMGSSLISSYETRNLNGNASGNKMIPEAICGSIEPPESMSLKKCVINSKESKDSAYKSLFQAKITKKETRVRSILSKLFTLKKSPRMGGATAPLNGGGFSVPTAAGKSKDNTSEDELEPNSLLSQVNCKSIDASNNEPINFQISSQLKPSQQQQNPIQLQQQQQQQQQFVNRPSSQSHSFNTPSHGSQLRVSQKIENSGSIGGGSAAATATLRPISISQTVSPSQKINVNIFGDPSTPGVGGTGYDNGAIVCGQGTGSGVGSAVQVPMLSSSRCLSPKFEEKQKSFTVQYSKENHSVLASRQKVFTQQYSPQAPYEQQSLSAKLKGEKLPGSASQLKRNSKRQESFFNQCNKEENIGYYQFKDDIAHLQVE